MKRFLILPALALLVGCAPSEESTKTPSASDATTDPSATKDPKDAINNEAMLAARKTALSTPLKRYQPNNAASAEAKDPETRWETDKDGNETFIYEAGNTNGMPVDVLSLMRSQGRGLVTKDGSSGAKQAKRIDSTSVNSDSIKKATAKGREVHDWLLQMGAQPDVSQCHKVIEIARAPFHPFAPLAIRVLGKMRIREAQDALQEMLAHEKPALRCAALGAILDANPPQALSAARNMLTDPSPDGRLAAVNALGILKDRESAPQLREMLDSEDPGLQLNAAWALCEMDDPAGPKHLRIMISSEQPAAACKAMDMLTAQRDTTAIRPIYYNLYHVSEQVMAAALRCLDAFSAEDRRRALSGLRNGEDIRLQARREQLLCYAGRLPLSRSILKMSESALMADRLYTMRCIFKYADPKGIPQLIDLAFDENKRIRKEAQVGLRTMLPQLSLTGWPAEFSEHSAWRKWWFREHKILATAPGQVLLAMPGGKTQPYHIGSRLAWDATIESIQVGQGEHHLEGASAMLECAGLPYSLLPH